MRKVDDQEIQSEDSGDLRQDQLININRHFKNRRTNRNNKMTVQMETMYKDALMNVIFGQFEEASKKLKNLIALYPDNPDAFHLLGTMHQQLGQVDKAVQYFFMSTYLSPPNIQKWIKVADMSMDSKMYTQAAYCYGRALKIQNYNIELMTKRAEAFQLSHQIKKAIVTYKKILSISYSQNVIKKYAKLKFRRGQFSSSREILKTCQKYFEDANLVYMICQTYLKEKNYKEILKEIGNHLDSTKLKQQSKKDLKDFPLQFVKIVYISCIMLRLKEFQYFVNNVENMREILIQSYQEQISQLYQDLLHHLKEQHEIRFVFTEILIKFKSHKTIQNYLFISQYLKRNHQYSKAIYYLKQGLSLYNNSAELSSQLNHLQVISSSQKINQKRKKPNNVLHFNYRKKQSEEDIFYSQSQQDQQNKIFHVQSKDKKTIKKDKKAQKQNQTQFVTKQIETDNPEVVTQLLVNSNMTLQSILQINLEIEQELSQSQKQVENCLQYIIKITQNYKEKTKQEKQGLFHKIQPRRRYYSSKKILKSNLIQLNIEIIKKILFNSISYLHKLLRIQQYYKIKSLCQLLSKGYFFRWQSKNIQLKKYKLWIYELGLLACLSLKKLDSASYFIRFLVNKDPQNQFYLLVVIYIIHNSQNKQCVNSLLTKHLNKNQVDIQKKTTQKEQVQDKLFRQSQEEQFFEINQKDLPMKQINKNQINVNVNYLFGIQYMQTGCFQLAISSFIKTINSIPQSMKQTIWLSLTACFLQLSSSRTTHTKLPHTNRSSYCFLHYLKYAKSSQHSLYNKARWLAQIKMNDKAIQEYNNLLKRENIGDQLKQKCVLNLLCIYKQMQNWQMMQLISKQFFSAQKYLNTKEIEIKQIQRKKQMNQEDVIFQEQ